MVRKIGERKVDEVGRIVLPTEARSLLGVENRQALAIYVDDSAKKIILQKDDSNG